MTGHHLIINGEGAPHVRCDEPATAPCRAVYDCGCEGYYDIGITDDGRPYHVPQPDEGEVHIGRFEEHCCTIAEWFSEMDTEDLLSGEYAIPLRVEWGIDSPILHLPEPNQETR